MICLKSIILYQCESNIHDNIAGEIYSVCKYASQNNLLLKLSYNKLVILSYVSEYETIAASTSEELDPFTIINKTIITKAELMAKNGDHESVCDNKNKVIRIKHKKHSFSMFLISLIII